ncbi:hypothetical protein HE1_01019 [Holospora elegans E1]|uniref:Uncharacterized protein n=1 Tax=Holospora elegans E1 TaxID=1427503 RepID=A0A023DYU9_9PROT|nr:hypothetical protein [Holospora elegans]GAJ46681.1 hypothetical protein HE1_01019 [Holospora elegans E1]
MNAQLRARIDTYAKEATSLEQTKIFYQETVAQYKKLTQSFQEQLEKSNRDQMIITENFLNTLKKLDQNSAAPESFAIAESSAVALLWQMINSEIKRIKNLLDQNKKQIENFNNSSNQNKNLIKELNQEKTNLEKKIKN